MAKKEGYIMFRCTPALKEKIQAEADSRGVTMSEFILDLIKAEFTRQEMNKTQVEHKEQ